MRRPLVMGNWKLNGSKAMVSDLINSIDANLQGVQGVDVAIAPPLMFIDQVQKQLGQISTKIFAGAQNTDVNANGAFTGDISPVMLKEFGVTHIIIGHSERRQYHGETDEMVAKKFGFLKQHGLIPVFCIGESEAQNAAGETVAVCARQIDAVINSLGAEALDGAVIAYEPIWAIGTGKAATAEDAQRIHASIRAHIASKNADVAKKVIIQYGGSVKPENAAAYFAQPDIDGALVGGASLDAASFAAIVKAAAK